MSDTQDTLEFIRSISERKSPIKSMRANCLECMGNSSQAVKECASSNCHLWPYRLGIDPWRKKVELSEQQKKDRAERLAKARDKASQ